MDRSGYSVNSSIEKNRNRGTSRALPGVIIHDQVDPGSIFTKQNCTDIPLRHPVCALVLNNENWSQYSRRKGLKQRLDTPAFL